MDATKTLKLEKFEKYPLTFCHSAIEHLPRLTVEQIYK